MIYLASPYTHPDRWVRDQRFDAACQAAARLMQSGHLVFSPIAHSHPIAAHGLRTDWSYWEAFARWHIERCDEVLVLTLDGWQQSVGVQAEIELARAANKSVRYVEQGTIDYCVIE